MNILILCTGNSCRSQMAEAFLRSLHPGLNVESAGTRPGDRVHPLAVQAMGELGIDMSALRPKSVDRFLDRTFDYVITVCDNARESCPVFTGQVGTNLHIGFDDPAEATGTPEEVFGVFRRVRDEIRRDFGRFFQDTLLPRLPRRGQ